MGKIKNEKSRLALGIFLALTTVWMIVIFCFSAQDSTESGSLSGDLLRKLLAFFNPHWNIMTNSQKILLMSKLHTLFRKLGHFSEYCVLGMLLTLTARRFCKNRFQQAIPHIIMRTIALPALLALCYAASDEFHQRFVAGRSCELRDVCIDFTGAALGIVVVTLSAHIIKNKKERVSAK